MTFWPAMMQFLQSGQTAPISASLAQAGPPAAAGASMAGSAGGFGGMMGGGPMAPAMPAQPAAPMVQMPQTAAPGMAPPISPMQGANPGMGPTAAAGHMMQPQNAQAQQWLQALAAQQKPEGDQPLPAPSVGGTAAGAGQMSGPGSQQIMQMLQGQQGLGMLPTLGSLIRGGM